MDTALKELTDLALKRGNKYIKGETALTELPDKMAELGVFLLEKANRLQGLGETTIKDDLIEVQNKLDDLRKCIFANKINPK
ncbi:MAG: hypothetical protein HZA17_01505 [Nitrospirae bacterium]|nr:hypothetical protein [Nitrospirota bacterium]